MFLLLLTAREGRVSANHLGCPSSRNVPDAPRRAHVFRTWPAPTHWCVSRSRPPGFLTTKPAIPPGFYDLAKSCGVGSLTRLAGEVRTTQPGARNAWLEGAVPGTDR